MKNDNLVNKDNSLSKEYCPNNLFDTKSKVTGHLDENHMVLLVDYVFEAFEKMKNDALKLGYDIEVESGYRSYSYQQKVLDYFIQTKGEDSYKIVALPGTSEHQTGLALDFTLFINGEDVNEVTDDQEETKWIHQNCYKYGFILRYPKGKEDITGYNYEPWHLRYVGNELAKYLYENNLTLEEYHKEKSRILIK